MRLIDAGALMAEMHNVILEDGEDRRTFYEIIERQTTIDPVKHGRWVKAEPDGCWSYSEVYKQCSECGKVTFLAEKMDYCPNCGAKMDEVKR